MTSDRHNLVGFLAVLVALLVLSGIGAATGKPADLAIMTGLIGVLGTFKPRASGVSDQTAQTLVDKLPPETKP